jgi:hypothetical protein
MNPTSSHCVSPPKHKILFFILVGTDGGNAHCFGARAQANRDFY